MSAKRRPLDYKTSPCTVYGTELGMFAWCHSYGCDMDMVCRTNAFITDIVILSFVTEGSMALEKEAHAMAADIVGMAWRREPDRPHDALTTERG